MDGWMNSIKMDLRKVGREVCRRMGLDKDCVQWQALVLALLNIWILLLEYKKIWD